MKKHITFVMAIAFFLGMACSACEGPTGSDGAQGPQGEQGPEGPQGPKGETGTANVIYSDWMDVEWTEGGDFDKLMGIEANDIQAEHMDNSVLLVYLKGGNVLRILPFRLENNQWYFQVWFFDSGNFVMVGAYSIDGVTPVCDDTCLDPYQVRYVLIPGGVPAKMGENFLKDYQAVKKYYGIPD